VHRQQKDKGKKMEVGKIIRIVAVLGAVVLAFVDIAQTPMIIAVLGLVAGYFIEEEYASRFLIGAVALGVSQGALASIPAVGGPLTAILGSLSALFYAGACTVIVMGVVNRLKP
jgi:predicted PurR-regulated permease PerM